MSEISERLALRSRFHLVASLFALAVTPICAVGGVLLIVNALGGRGSVTGNILAGGAGFLLLLISPILCTFGVAAWDIANQSNQLK
jgi:hypothetical protein